MIRDLAEVREMGFPVFARGVMPIAGAKNVVAPLNEPVKCGGIVVDAGDVVVADEEGIVVVPRTRLERVLADARDKMPKEARESLAAWEAAHRSRIDGILASHGFAE